MNTINASRESSKNDTPAVHSYWHTHQVQTASGTHYEVKDSLGQVIATGIKVQSHARLIALAPLLHENFDPLLEEAERALHHMLDVNEGMLDFSEVAEDENGEWEDACSGAPDFAQWLIDMDELREALG